MRHVPELLASTLFLSLAACDGVECPGGYLLLGNRCVRLADGGGAGDNDGGTLSNAGQTASGASTTGQGVSGASLDVDSGVTCDGATCPELCASGGPHCAAGQSTDYRPCTNPLPAVGCTAVSIDNAVDGGLGDGGSKHSAFDASSTLGDGGDIMIGDATFTVEAGALTCPTGTECNAVLRSFTGGTSTCAQPGALLPDACTGTTPCMLGTATGSCQSGFCIVPCN